MTKMRFIRITRGYSQIYLAGLSLVSQPLISLIESGCRHPSTKQRLDLAAVLQCDPSTLLDEYVPDDAEVLDLLRRAKLALHTLPEADAQIILRQFLAGDVS